MSKLNLTGLKQKSQEIADDPNVQAFISQAESEPEPETGKPKANLRKTSGKRLKSNPFKKSFEEPKVLSVSGKLTNRNETCGDQLGIYLKKEIEQWIDRHTLGDQGGKQIVLNVLIAYGICSVIEQYEKQGAIFLNFEEQWPDIRDFITQFSAEDAA